MVIIFFSCLLALGFGFGLAFWICGSMLDRSNNIGDSRGDGATYNAETTFTSRNNRMDRSASKEYFKQSAVWKGDTKGPAGYEQVRRLTEEERQKKAAEEKKANVPKGAFVSQNTSASPSSDKYDKPDWEKRAEHYY